MKPPHVLLSILIILSICISPVCSISINTAKFISTAPEKQGTAAQAPSEQGSTSPSQLAGGPGNSNSAVSASTVLMNSFDHYQVNYYDNSMPDISLYRGLDTPVGIILFYPDGSTPLPDTGLGSDQEIRISYPLSQFTNIINMLRYTSGTLNIFINRETTGIGTGTLQVGVT